MPKFVLINGIDAGLTFELTAEETVIGRQMGVEIKLSGANISRRHARVWGEGGLFFVEDLNSSNGIFLNGVKVAGRAALKPRDEVRVGSHLLRFETPSADPEVTIQARAAANSANLDLFRENPARKLQILLQLSNDLARSLDLNQLLAEILEHLFAFFPKAERGLVVLLEGGKPVVRAHRQREGKPAAPQFSNSILHKVITEKIGIIAEDVLADARFAEAQSICSLGVRSFMCVPLQSKSGKPFGILELERLRLGDKFTAEDLNLLTTIALQVSVALENAQLHQELLARKHIERELALAREIQIGYLPTSAPNLPDKSFELHAELFPAYEISGDFYDYFKFGENRLALKGVGPTLLSFFSNCGQWF